MKQMLIAAAFLLVAGTALAAPAAESPIGSAKELAAALAAPTCSERFWSCVNSCGNAGCIWSCVEAWSACDSQR